MNLVCADIPDDAAALPAWLERHLAGGRLADLVAELAAANGPGDGSRSLADVLGPHVEGVRAAGLAKLPPEALRELLRRPALLLALQEWALLEGGPYWQRLFEAAPTDPAVARGARRLDDFLAGNLRPAADPSPGPPAWYRRPWLVAFATAACVLLGLYVARLASPPPPTDTVAQPPAVAWGWDRPGALRQDVSAREYLENLAAAAEEWSKLRPETAPALARRLNEFRAGCSTLILSTHGPLDEADREWLRGRCQVWADEIDKALARLEEDGRVVSARDDADKLVRKIALLLRDRAARA